MLASDEISHFQQLSLLIITNDLDSPLNGS